MKITIIGCGWLGFPLALELKNRGFIVYGTSRSQDKIERLKRNGIIGLYFDANESIVLPQEVLDSNWFIYTFPPSKLNNYVKSSNEIFNQLNKDAFFMYTSSIGVYVSHNNPIDESGVVDFDSPIIKVEDLVRNRFQSHYILRLAGLIGEDRHPIVHLSGKVLKNALNRVNLVQQSDVINAIIAIINAKPNQKTFNVCFPDHPSKKDYYTKKAMEYALKLPMFDESQIGDKEILASEIAKQTPFKYNYSI